MEEQSKSFAKQSAGQETRPEDRSRDELTSEGLAELREHKNAEYMRAALSMVNPLAAGVGVLNGDLMVFANHMQRVIMPALNALPTDPVAFAKLMPAVVAYARVARQVERLATLTDRLNRQQTTRSAAAKAVAKENVPGSSST